MGLPREERAVGDGGVWSNRLRPCGVTNCFALFWSGNKESVDMRLGGCDLFFFFPPFDFM